MKALFISIGTVSLFLILLILFKNESIVGASTLSYPISYSVIEYPIGDLGLNTDLLPEMTVKLEKRKGGSLKNKNIINFQVGEELQLIPLTSKKEDSALKVLESFLVNNVGIIPKNSQRTYKDKGFDVVEIGYFPFQNDGMKWTRIFTLYKKNELSWLFTTGFFVKDDIVDSLNTDSPISESYFTLIKSFRIGTDKINKELFNNVGTEFNNKNWIEQYKRNNFKFDTNLL